MANKKKKQPEPVVIETVKVEPEVCGHINRHANPELICTLPKGHPGNHFNGSAWSDAAGTPPRKHK